MTLSTDQTDLIDQSSKIHHQNRNKARRLSDPLLFSDDEDDNHHQSHTSFLTSNSLFSDFPTSPSPTTADHSSARPSPGGVHHFTNRQDKSGFSIELEQEPLSPCSTNDTIDHIYQTRTVLYRGDPLKRRSLVGGGRADSNGIFTPPAESPSTAQTDRYPLTPADEEDLDRNGEKGDDRDKNRLTTLLFDLKMDDLDAGYHQAHQYQRRIDSGPQARLPDIQNSADSNGKQNDLKARYSKTSSLGTDRESPATTPTSATHEIFHDSADKMQGNEVDGLARATQSVLAISTGTNPSTAGHNAVGPLPIKSATSNSNLRAPQPLPLSQSPSSGRRGRDVSPPRRSPLNQVTGFEEAQREWQHRNAGDDRDPATGFPLPPNASQPTGDSNGQQQYPGHSLSSYRSQNAYFGRQDQSLDEEMLGSPHGSSPVSPFNPRPGLTSFSPGRAGGRHVPSSSNGLASRAAINSSAYGRSLNQSGPEYLQNPTNAASLGGPHSASQPEIRGMVQGHQEEHQRMGQNVNDAEAYGPEVRGQKGLPGNILAKPVLQRAWSDGAEANGIRGRTNENRSRLQQYEEEQSDRAAMSDARATVGSSQAAGEGETGSRMNAESAPHDSERPFAIVSVVLWFQTLNTWIDCQPRSVRKPGCRLCYCRHWPTDGWQDDHHPQSVPLMGVERTRSTTRRRTSKSSPQLYRSGRDGTASAYEGCSDSRDRLEPSSVRVSGWSLDWRSSMA